MHIAETNETHRSSIGALLRSAFGGDEEVKLVEALIRDGLVVLSLGAFLGDAPIGHILFSRLDVFVDANKVEAVSLAPLAVAPALQRQGVGTALIRRSLGLLRECGWQAAFVLGHPDYYPRFGFSAELTRNLRSPFSGPSFMAIELAEGVLSGAGGSIRYPDAFGLNAAARTEH